MSRLDSEMAERGLVKSRSLAQALIKDEKVAVNGKTVAKASFSVRADDVIEIIGELPRYVGRGGLKLEKAINDFSLDLTDKVCIDVGASTGGFTDCMLQNGAKKVYAVDVGTAQLDEKLRQDSRVVSLENLDIRVARDEIDEKVDFASIDVSFISLKLILPEIKRFLKKGSVFVALIKPQFEVGKQKLGKNGVVKDEKMRLGVVEDIKSFSAQIGYEVLGVVESAILGGDGNKEFLICLRY